MWNLTLLMPKYKAINETESILTFVNTKMIIYNFMPIVVMPQGSLKMWNTIYCYKIIENKCIGWMDGWFLVGWMDD